MAPLTGQKKISVEGSTRRGAFWPALRSGPSSMKIGIQLLRRDERLWEKLNRHKITCLKKNFRPSRCMTIRYTRTADKNVHLWALSIHCWLGYRYIDRDPHIINPRLDALQNPSKIDFLTFSLIAVLFDRRNSLIILGAKHASFVWNEEKGKE